MNLRNWLRNLWRRVSQQIVLQGRSIHSLRNLWSQRLSKLTPTTPGTHPQSEVGSMGSVLIWWTCLTLPPPMDSTLNTQRASMFSHPEQIRGSSKTTPQSTPRKLWSRLIMKSTSLWIRDSLSLQRVQSRLVRHPAVLYQEEAQGTGAYWRTNGLKIR